MPDMYQTLLFSGEDIRTQQNPFRSSKFSIDDLLTDDLSFQEVETTLEEFLEAKISNAEKIDVAAVPETDMGAKFRYSSAMQKSIRRGYVNDAVKYALTYHALDSSGFWRRLVVVAFEDIGVGGAMEVALTLIAAKSRSWRRKAGGDEKIIHYIIKALAESVKDRSACDKMFALMNCPRKPKVLTALKTASLQELSGMVLSERLPSSIRTSAAWLLWGTDKFENKQLPLRQGSREHFTDTIEKLNVPPLIKYITLRGMTACRYPMNLVYPFVWEQMQKSLYVRVIEASLPPERYYIGGLPEEAFDQYVREGKSSLVYFGKACKPVDDWLSKRGITSRDTRMAALGAAVFICEGAKLDRMLVFEGSDEIVEAAAKFDYANAGLSLDDGRTLAGMIEANSDILRLSRMRVVEGTSKEFS